MADANLPAPPTHSVPSPTGREPLDFNAIPGHHRVEPPPPRELNFDMIPSHRVVEPKAGSGPSVKNTIEDLIGRIVEEFSKLPPEEQERRRQNIRDGIAALAYPDGKPGVPPGE